jgi:hypothetical protein
MAAGVNVVVSKDDQSALQPYIKILLAHVL